MWGETTRVENRGETTRGGGGGDDQGGNVLGAKRLVTFPISGLLAQRSKQWVLVINMPVVWESAANILNILSKEESLK